jgi:hypothetical protein
MRPHKNGCGHVPTANGVSLRRGAFVFTTFPIFHRMGQRSLVAEDRSEVSPINPPPQTAVGAVIVLAIANWLRTRRAPQATVG